MTAKIMYIIYLSIITEWIIETQFSLLYIVFKRPPATPKKHVLHGCDIIF